VKYLYELINKYSFNSVWLRLLKHYPEEVRSEKKYRKVYEQLQFAKVPKLYEDNYITVEYVRKSKWNDEGYPDVALTVDGEDYSMTFVDWYELLGYKVAPQKRYSLVQSVAYWLYEATFYGFSQKKIQKYADEVVGRIEEVKLKDKVQ